MKEYSVYPNTNPSSPNGTMLQVRINSKGTFTFSMAATRLLEAENIKAVFLLYDAKSRSVAFRAADPDALCAFKLNRDYPEMRIRNKAFFRNVGWQIPTTITFSASWNADKKTLELAPLTRKEAGSTCAHDTEGVTRSDTE
ncbi:MAG: hypothetical protein ACJ8BW_13740 [Ktedonobacteraceae bacterium]|jgi:hypothetical protein